MKAAEKKLGYPAKLFCPCKDCRIVSHQTSDDVLERLVIRGMDLKYKRGTCWTKHGDQALNGEVVDNETTNDEAYNLYRAAYSIDEDFV